MEISVTLTFTMFYDAGRESGKGRKSAENKQFRARFSVRAGSQKLAGPMQKFKHLRSVTGTLTRSTAMGTGASSNCWRMGVVWLCA